MVMEDENILDALKPFLTKEEKERDLQDEIQFYGHHRRYVDFLLEAVSEFFQQDLEEIVKSEAVWKFLQEKLRIRLKWILEDKEQFLKDYPPDMEDIVQESLQELERQAENFMRRQQQQIWQFADLKQAIQTLKKSDEKGIFVALLDDKGKLLDEPYPVTVDITTVVRAKVEVDRARKQRKNIVAKAVGKPFKTTEPGMQIKSIVLCEAPENFAKARVIKLK